MPDFSANDFASIRARMAEIAAERPDTPPPGAPVCACVADPSGVWVTSGCPLHGTGPDKPAQDGA